MRMKSLNTSQNLSLIHISGDNFNAGFILGRMLGFDLEESLLMGTANSGFYVREARSATYQELQQFIENWSENKLEA